jgi:hypothetical protein
LTAYAQGALKMKLHKWLVPVFLILGVGLTVNSAFARSQEEITRDIVKAADTAVSTYRETGMSGLIGETEECYKHNTKNPFYCVYLDLASRHIDQLFVESMNFPPNEFFSDENLGSRVSPVLSDGGMSFDTANRYLMISGTEINKLVETKLHKHLGG